MCLLVRAIHSTRTLPLRLPAIPPFPPHLYLHPIPFSSLYSLPILSVPLPVSFFPLSHPLRKSLLLSSSSLPYFSSSFPTPFSSLPFIPFTFPSHTSVFLSHPFPITNLLKTCSSFILFSSLLFLFLSHSFPFSSPYSHDLTILSVPLTVSSFSLSHPLQKSLVYLLSVSRCARLCVTGSSSPYPPHRRSSSPGKDHDAVWKCDSFYLAGCLRGMSADK